MRYSKNTALAVPITAYCISYRHPGLRVADLLDVLKITKQSLARVLKQLIGKGFIMQRAATTTAVSGVCSSPPRAAVWPKADSVANQAHRVGPCQVGPRGRES